MGKLPATLLQHFKVFAPRTPGLRNKRLVRTDDCYQGPPIESLLSPLHKTGGRCRFTGRITSRHRGGGEKHPYRIIDWSRKLTGPHEVLRLEVDPNRSARIALLKHVESNRLSYILAPKGVQAGDVLQSGADVPPNKGNCLPLSAIPPGTLIHNIGLRPGEGGKIARSAGKSSHFE
jgi:large subunit ribosomal protein L2